MECMRWISAATPESSPALRAGLVSPPRRHFRRCPLLIPHRPFFLLYRSPHHSLPSPHRRHCRRVIATPPPCYRRLPQHRGLPHRRSSPRCLRPQSIATPPGATPPPPSSASAAAALALLTARAHRELDVAHWEMRVPGRTGGCTVKLLERVCSNPSRPTNEHERHSWCILHHNLRALAAYLLSRY